MFRGVVYIPYSKLSDDQKGLALSQISTFARDYGFDLTYFLFKCIFVEGKSWHDRGKCLDKRPLQTFAHLFNAHTSGKYWVVKGIPCTIKINVTDFDDPAHENSTPFPSPPIGVYLLPVDETAFVLHNSRVNELERYRIFFWLTNGVFFAACFLNFWYVRSYFLPHTAFDVLGWLIPIPIIILFFAYGWFIKMKNEYLHDRKNENEHFNAPIIQKFLEEK